MRIKIGTRVIGYLACILGIVLGLGVFGFVANARAASEMRGSLAEAFEVATAIDNLILLARQARLIVSAAAAAGTETDLPSVDATALQFGTIVEQIELRKPGTVKLKRMMSEVRIVGRAFVEANARQQWNLAADLSTQFETRSGELLAALERTDEEQKAYVAGQFADAAASAHRRNAYFAGGFALCVTLGLFLTWSLQRRLVNPLVLLTASTSRSIESGDLGQMVSISSRDEIGQLADTFSRLVRKLGGMLEELRRRDRELADSNAQLRQSLAELRAAQTRLVTSDRLVALGVLAAGVAHEINNPLTYVAANVSFAANEVVALASSLGPTTLERTQESLKEALEGTQRIASIVRDMKILSRDGENDRQELVELRPVIEAALNVARGQIKHRAVMETDFGPVPLVRGNAARLGQVFLNLVVNAAQSLDNGRSDNRIRVVTKTLQDGNAAVDVEDTGCGVPESLRQRIFDPFFTTKPVGQGTGLGLSICHGIVAAMGGRIELESEVGRGSVFRVVLPPSAPDVELAANG
jgi:C4-dicarboxylate-specific signal transduction histidine kinase